MLKPYTGLKNAFLLFCLITVFVSFSDVYAMEPSETVVSDGTLLQAHTDIFLDRLKCVHPFLPSLPPSIYVIYDKNDLDCRRRIDILCESFRQAGLPTPYYDARPGGKEDLYQHLDKISDVQNVIVLGSPGLKAAHLSGLGLLNQEITRLLTRMTSKGKEGIILAWLSGVFEDSFHESLHHLPKRDLKDYHLSFFDLLMDIFSGDPLHHPMKRIKEEFEKLRVVPFDQLEAYALRLLAYQEERAKKFSEEREGILDEAMRAREAELRGLVPLVSAVGGETLVRDWGEPKERVIVASLPERNTAYLESKPAGSADSYLTLLWKGLRKSKTLVVTSKPGLTKRTVAGTGGVGKSSAAAALVYEALEHKAYEFIGWINCGGGNGDESVSFPPRGYGSSRSVLVVGLTHAGKSSFINSCYRVLSNLDVPASDSETVESVVEKVKRHLPEKAKSWLLVYDDAPSAESLYGLIPQSGEDGNVVITTRNSTGSRRQETLNLDVFQAPESIRFLLNETGREFTEENCEAALKVAEALGHLPLALAQAASYMNNNGKSFEDYLRDFETKKAFLLSYHAGVDDYPYVVLTTWDITMQSMPPFAQRLMAYFAYLDTNNIPVSLFENEGIFGAALAELEPSLDALVRFSMVKRSGDNLAVHPLVQAVTGLKEELRKVENLKILLRFFIEERDRGFYFSDSSRETILRLRNLTPHALKVFKHAEELGFAENIILGIRVAAFFNREHRYQEAADFLEKLRILSQSSPELAARFDVAIRNNLINAYVNMDDYDRASGIPFDGLPSLSKAIVMHCLGEYSDAEGLYLKALADFGDKIAKDESNQNNYLHCALTHKNLGGLYEGTGRLAAARKQLGEARDIYRSIFRDEQNGDIASILAYLAKTMSTDPSTIADPSTITLYEQALKIFSDLYPQGNPEMLRCMIDYAETLTCLGKKIASETQYKKAIEIAKMLYGDKSHTNGISLMSATLNINNSSPLSWKRARKEVRVDRSAGGISSSLDDTAETLLSFDDVIHFGYIEKGAFSKHTQGIFRAADAPLPDFLARSRKRTIDIDF